MNFQRIEKEPSVYVQKKCCTVSYYKKKCQKELEIQMIERRAVERGGMGVIAILLVVGSKFKFFFLFMHWILIRKVSPQAMFTIVDFAINIVLFNSVYNNWKETSCT